MARIHLITFGGGGRNFERAARRLVRQSLGFPEIVTARAFGPDDLGDDYNEMFPDFAQRYPRGLGLWSWKPYLIWQEINEIGDGEYLLYVDGGCELNATAAARFKDYVEFANENDLLFFGLATENQMWTKSDPRLFADSSFATANQFIATILLIKKTDRTVNFSREWLDLSSQDDGFLLKDVEGEPQLDCFNDHRHDQSTMNVIAYKYGFRSLPDETFIPAHNLRKFVNQAMKIPILTLRNKDGIPLMPLIKFLSRFFRQDSYR